MTRTDVAKEAGQMKEMLEQTELLKELEEL